MNNAVKSKKNKFECTGYFVTSPKAGNFPNLVMFTFHPQRWTDRLLPWGKELVWQNVKNLGKWVLLLNLLRPISNIMNKYIPLIVDKLKTINPVKIILFGSQANENFSEGSDIDIDIIVVTNDKIIPRNYTEKSGIYIKVSNLISEYKKKVPIDLIIYTSSMFDKFVERGSMFSKEVLLKGKASH